MSTLAEKVQEIKDKHGVDLKVDGETVTYPGVKGPDQKGPGTRTFSRADLDDGVFESWFELAHAQAKGKTPEKTEKHSGSEARDNDRLAQGKASNIQGTR